MGGSESTQEEQEQGLNGVVSCSTRYAVWRLPTAWAAEVRKRQYGDFRMVADDDLA